MKNGFQKISILKILQRPSTATDVLFAFGVDAADVMNGDGTVPVEVVVGTAVPGQVWTMEQCSYSESRLVQPQKRPPERRSGQLV